MAYKMFRLRFSLKTILVGIFVISIPLGWIGMRLHTERKREACLRGLYCTEPGTISGFFLGGPANYTVEFAHDELLHRGASHPNPEGTDLEGSNVRCLFVQPHFSQGEFSKLPEPGFVFSRATANLNARQNESGWLDQLFPATAMTDQIYFAEVDSSLPGGNATVVQALEQLPNLEGVFVANDALDELGKSEVAQRLKFLLVTGRCAPQQLATLEAFPNLLALKFTVDGTAQHPTVQSLPCLENMKKLRFLDVRDTWSSIHSGRSTLQDSACHSLSKLTELRSLTVSAKLTGHSLDCLEDLGNLVELRIIESNLSPRGIENLIRLKRLKYVSLPRFHTLNGSGKVQGLSNLFPTAEFVFSGTGN